MFRHRHIESVVNALGALSVSEPSPKRTRTQGGLNLLCVIRGSVRTTFLFVPFRRASSRPISAPSAKASGTTQAKTRENTQMLQECDQRQRALSTVRDGRTNLAVRHYANSRFVWSPDDPKSSIFCQVKLTVLPSVVGGNTCRNKH